MNNKSLNNKRNKKSKISIWHLDPFTQSFNKMSSIIDYSTEASSNNEEIYYEYDDPTPLCFMLWK